MYKLSSDAKCLKCGGVLDFGDTTRCGNCSKENPWIHGTGKDDAKGCFCSACKRGFTHWRCNCQCTNPFDASWLCETAEMKTKREHNENGALFKNILQIAVWLVVGVLVCAGFGLDIWRGLGLTLIVILVGSLCYAILDS